MKLFAIVLMTMLLGSAAVPGKPPPEEKTGIKAGEKAPEFQLKDQAGKEHSLADFTKKGKVALVFYRSASW